MNPRRPRSVLVASGIATLALLAAVGSASAQTTIGELAPPSSATNLCVGGPFDIVPAGPAVSRYTVPTAGVITSWSTRSGSGTGQELTFKVFRPAGAGSTFPKFTVVGQDGPRALLPEGVDTFATGIPVMAGDLIGANDDNAELVPNSCLFETTDPTDTVFLKEGAFAPGETFEADREEVGYSGARLNLTVTILAVPTISSVAPDRGPAAGGTAITIGGAEFARVESVSVGASSVPFEATSETSITATVPAGAAGASVPVTVTTVAGSASSAFAYEAAAATPAPVTTLAPSCKVPKLDGKRLKAARKALAKAHCRLGKVTRKKGVAAGKGKVAHQRPRPGAERGAGSKVSVRLAAGRQARRRRG